MTISFSFKNINSQIILKLPLEKLEIEIILPQNPKVKGPRLKITGVNSLEISPMNLSFFILFCLVVIINLCNPHIQYSMSYCVSILLISPFIVYPITALCVYHIFGIALDHCFLNDYFISNSVNNEICENKTVKSHYV